ncbi:MAG: glutamate racemase [Eubacteriales bacterium]|nr:glutamate racemase [Eubacteriales bacterium]
MIIAENEKPIGMFDSGVGGLTVAREVMRNIPNERIVYFGDTARVPYGGKSKDTILRYSRQIVRFLQQQDVKAIVVACNTASAFALEEIRTEIDIPMIGVVKPGAKIACEVTKNNRIGVIGTKGTISSGLYTEFIRDINPCAQVIGKACPLFVPLVEENMLKDPVTVEMATRYLSGLKEQDIDTLILGCTHYPLLRSVIREVVGETVTLVNPAYETARSLKCLLEERGLANTKALGDDSNPYQFYVSDAADSFREFANTILPVDIRNATKINNIEEYQETGGTV